MTPHDLASPRHPSNADETNSLQTLTGPLSRRAVNLSLATGLAQLMGASLLGTGAYSATLPSGDVQVRTPQELETAINQARPGDRIVMADGQWDSLQIRLRGEGTLEAPITLSAQTPGQVFLTGNSSLKIQGRHLVARGLVFKDGSTPDSQVIVVGDHHARIESTNCRVTECSIVRFNPAIKETEGIWVSLSGTHHRVDHCHFEGKTDKGPTLAVLLDSTHNAPNQHVIEFNHFGPRPALGKNGGETIRVGTGAFSTQKSETRIENNLFEACSGELEIISIKSWNNRVTGNVFLRCQGTLTFRQGQQNLAEGNVFMGGGVSYTGGIRIISTDQTVRNNVFIGLRGTSMHSALSFMNGAPGASVGSYAPVERALVERNTFMDVTAITLGLHADAKLTQAPLESRFRDNLIVNCPKDLFVQLSSIEGIAFDNNAVIGSTKGPIKTGFQDRESSATADAGTWTLPLFKGLDGVGSSLIRFPFERAAAGPSYVRS